MGDRQIGIDKGESGFALLIAIGFLLVVTAVIAPFVLAARTALDTAAATLRSDRLRFVAEGLATVVAHDLAALPEEELRRFAPGVRSDPAGCRSDGLAIELRVQDQRGLVDLNIAGEDLLEAGLRSVGLGPSDAAANARAIVVYRSGDEAESRPFADPTEAIIRDGPKKAPFEAVEELYDFQGLAAVPFARLVRTFTVHARQTQIVGSRMPDALAEILPRTPAPGFPFIANDAAGVGTFRIEVFLRAPDDTIGYADLVVAAEADGDFAIVESAGSPTSATGGRGAPVAVTSCEALFGPAAVMMRGIAA